MKKLLVIAILLVYGASSSGMTLYIHYCCGKVETLGLSPVSGKNCKEPGKTGLAKTPCCEDKTLSFSLKADQVPANFIVPSFLAASLPAHITTLLLSTPIYHGNRVQEVFAPPPLPIKDLTRLYCIYRI